MNMYKHHAVQYLSHAEHIKSTLINHIYTADGRKETVNSLLTGKDAKIWNPSMSNELGRIAQGNNAGVAFADCVDYISYNDVPKNKKVTYASFVCDYRPMKDDKYRIRLVVGGDKLVYEADTGSPAASMLETKLLINSVISDAKDGARFMSADLKDFFLQSIMPEAEYMKIPWKYFPTDIRTRYKLHDKVHKDYIYVRIRRGMYGLKQAAILAYDQLVAHLKPHGYLPVPGTNGIFRHTTRRTKFCLCVDDIGIKYYNDDDVEHLLNVLRLKYTVTVGREGKHYCGYTFHWHYDKGYVDMSMPDYVKQALHKLNHKSTKHQYSPHAHTPIRYGRVGERQETKPRDTSPFLQKRILHIYNL